MIQVNGRSEPPAASIAELLARLGIAADARGVAIAVDGEVVPRSAWASSKLPDNAKVEVVGAIQGG